MKQDRISELAQNLNISKATVSKALRHCSGVESGTRQNILDRAGERETPRDTAGCPIYAILPDIPAGHWRELRDGIFQCAHETLYPINCNIYTRLHDDETVLAYLREARRLRPKALLVAIAFSDAIRKELAAWEPGCLILQISETHPLTNSFTVGADAYGDGAALGRRAAEYCAYDQFLYLALGNSVTVSQRLLGFFSTLDSLLPGAGSAAVPIAIEPQWLTKPKLFPAHLAAALAAAVNPFPPSRHLCLYAPFGFHGLMLAIDKAGIAGRVTLVGHDLLPESAASCPAIVCRQDLRAQGRMAIRLAEEFIATGGLYPPEKHILIPSAVVLPPEWA